MYSFKKSLNPVFNRSVTGVLVCVSDCWFLRSYFASSRSLFTRPESDWPDKFSAHRAESGLPEEGGDELVVLYEVDLGLLDGPSSTVQGGSLFLLHRKFALFQAERKTESVKQCCCSKSKVGYVLITKWKVICGDVSPFQGQACISKDQQSRVSEHRLFIREEIN